MQFNRVAGFYFGCDLWKEIVEEMSLEDKNNELNEIIGNRLEQFNAALAQAELKLREMKFPCDIWYTVSQNGEDGRCTFQQIGMAKLKSEWCLCFAHGVDNGGDGSDDSFEFKPIREATIWERRLAARSIEKLRERIVQAKEQLIKDLERETKRLAESLQKMA